MLCGMHIIAKRNKIQPYIYVPSEDILIRTKAAVPFRSIDGAPESVGCLLLYFLLRHHKMLSSSNIKAICSESAQSGMDVKCEWKEAVSISEQRNQFRQAVKLQRWPNVPKPNICSTTNIEIEQQQLFASLLLTGLRSKTN